MKAQAQVWVWGEGGEQLAVLSGSVATAEFDVAGFIEQVLGWIKDYFTSGTTKLAADAEQALKTLGGDVKGEGSETEAFGEGGVLYNGDVRLASYAHVFFHAWTGDDIKPSMGSSEPGPTPGLVNLGEVRYTRGDFQYEYRFLLQFSLLPSGKYAFAFATGDSGTIQDATIAYTVGVTINPPANPFPTIQEKHDQLAANKWYDLGAPTTDELQAPDGAGRYRHYQNGSLYWSPGRGAHLVHGRIRDRWADTRWEQGFGYPLTDELGTPDGVGRFNHFQSCSIYWTPQTDAHETHGAIREKWASLGWERSYLGYPTTDEIAVGDPADTRYSNFQGGSIRWTPKTGALDYHAPLQP